MPRKNKKASTRPTLGHNNESLRRDIEMNKEAHQRQAGSNDIIDPFAADDQEAEDAAFDIADELLAALDKRDAAEAEATAKKEAQADKQQKNKSHHHHSLRETGGRLVNGLFHPGHNHNHNNHDTEPSSQQDSSSLVGTSPNNNSGRKGSIRRIFGSSPKSPEPSLESHAPGAGKKKVNRQQQRKEKKAAEMEAMRREAEEELKANGGKPDQAEIERQGIQAMCSALKVEMYEITPDGHCLYAAIADQLNLRKKMSPPVDYKLARKATAQEMRSHPEEYKPFISDSDEQMAGILNKEAGTLNSEQVQEKYFLNYCDAVEKTGVWGGQPEILALSKAFQTQINVVQAGMPILKVGEGEYEGEPLFISYHRKMYGLGEHYNSLRPAA